MSETESDQTESKEEARYPHNIPCYTLGPNESFFRTTGTNFYICTNTYQSTFVFVNIFTCVLSLNEEPGSVDGWVQLQSCSSYPPYYQINRPNQPTICNVYPKPNVRLRLTVRLHRRVPAEVHRPEEPFEQQCFRTTSGVLKACRGTMQNE